MEKKYDKAILEFVAVSLVLVAITAATTRITDTYVNTTGTMNGSVIWEGNVKLTDKYVELSDNLWNTTTQIWVVVDNSTFRKISEGWRGNTTKEIWAVADNGTFVKLSQNLWNTTTQIWAVVDNGTFNTSAGVAAYVSSVNATMKTYVISVNDTMKTFVLSVNSTMKAYALELNATMKAYADSEIQRYNSTMKTYVLEVNGTLKTYVLSVNDTMRVYALALNSTMKNYVDSKTATAGGNTTAQIWAVADNNTFTKLSMNLWNTTAQIWSVVDNSTFVKLSQNLWNTTAQIMAVVNSTNINSTAYINTTKGMSIGSAYKLCLNYACSRYIYDNGTATIIQG